jgi:thiamine pyrophosphate-dependent acetolactate synthase large subunit-like protein
LSRPITSAADVVLICGTYILPEVFPALDHVFRDDAQVIHIDLDAYEMGKNFPFSLGLLADPKKTLGKIVDAMEGCLSPEERQAAQDRVRSSTDRIRQRREAALEQDRQGRDQVPLLLSRFAEELKPWLQERDTLIFDEALTNSDALCRWIPPNVPKTYFLTRGGSLGVGLPGAIGLKLAHPEKTVIGFAGDGGAMYTIQALWTAAHPVGKDRRKIGAKFVICNNRSYHILKLNIDDYWHRYGINRHPYPSAFDITDPDIRFDRLAESMGVAGVRVEKPHEIRPAIERMLADDEPFLIDLVIA